MFSIVCAFFAGEGMGVLDCAFGLGGGGGVLVLFCWGGDGG